MYYVGGVAKPGLDSNGTGYCTSDNKNYINGVVQCDAYVVNEIVNSNNLINYSLSTMPSTFTVTFDFKSGGGNGADGAFFYYYAKGTTKPSGSNGGSFPNGKYQNPDNDAYRIVFDEYQGNMIGIYWNGSRISTTYPGIDFDNNVWRSAKIEVNQGNIKVYIDNTLRVDFTDSSYSSRDKAGRNNFGLGGFIGGLDNFHAFRKFNFYDHSVSTTAAVIEDIVSSQTSPIGEMFYVPGAYYRTVFKCD